MHLARRALVAGFAICGATTNGLIGTHFIPSAHDHGMPETTAAGLLAVVGLFDIVGTIASGWLTDRFNPRILLAVYYQFRGIGLLAQRYPERRWRVVIVGGVSGTGRLGGHRLDELAESFDCVSAVHGWGLSIGVDIVDPATGGPDAGRTRRIVNGARERDVLIGTTGLERSTLKIRPPLVFTDEHTDLLVAALDRILP